MCVYMRDCGSGDGILWGMLGRGLGYLGVVIFVGRRIWKDFYSCYFKCVCVRVW